MIVIVLDRYVFTDAANAIFYDPVFIFFLVTLGGIAGAAATAYSDWLKRMLIDQAYLDNVTRQRAENAFLEEEVFNTRQRTGIMIFISFFEHEVIVMADRGISKVVDQKQWDEIVNNIIVKIRTGKIIDGLEAGIRKCGEVLLANGFHKTDDDVNELRDDLRID
jgi:putative membrane protein